MWEKQRERDRIRVCINRTEQDKKMIDLHAHILPGADDGSDSLEESLEMAELALESGVDILVATPHSNQEGRFENYCSEELESAFIRLQRALRKERLPLKILPGMEIFSTEDIKEKITAGMVKGLGRTEYYLVEFPFDAEPWWIGERLEDILDAGKIPLIAHPERYFCVCDYPGFVYEWIQMGCLTQANKGSILGRFGREVRDAVHILLQHGLVHCVASDAHSAWIRTPHMGEIREYLGRYFGYETAGRLLNINPMKIIKNKPVFSYGRKPEAAGRTFW